MAFGAVAPQRLEESEVAVHVEFEVAHRIAHRLDVADLAGDVEHDIGAGDRVGHLRRADVGDQHVRPVGRVRTLAAVVRDERVDHHHVGAGRRQSVRDIRADEAQTTGHHAPLPAEGRGRVETCRSALMVGAI